MSEVEQTTLNLILSAAMQEFLKKGFKSASPSSVEVLGKFRSFCSAPSYRPP